MKTILLTALGLTLGILIGACVSHPPTVQAQASPTVWVYEVMPPGQMILKGNQFLAMSCTSDKAGNPQCFIASK